MLQSRVCEQALLSGLPGSLEEIHRLQQMLSHLEDETRNLVAGSSAGRRHGEDSLAEIRRLCEVFRIAHPSIRLDLCLDSAHRRLPRSVGRATATVLAEALANAARHGEPVRIGVELKPMRGAVLLRVQDNGRGFDVRQAVNESAGTPLRHWGLRIMQEQAERVGGRLEISSAAGRGTQVTLFIPLSRSRSASSGTVLPVREDQG